MFFKYRTRWSHGKSAWSIIEAKSSKALKSHFEESNDYDYSEHFRGYEWVQLKKVPAEYIEHLINKNLDKIQHLEEEICRLKKIETKNVPHTCSSCKDGPRKTCRYSKNHPYVKMGTVKPCIKFNQWKEMWRY